MPRTTRSSAFVRELHWALNHLYDPVGLQASPLVGLFGLAGRGDPLAALRHLLLEAVVALRPDSDVPPQTDAWRLYHILWQRYKEQFSQPEVARDLALSVRQLRRYESRALRALADYLRSCYDLQTENLPPTPPTMTGPLWQTSGTGNQQQELEWLRKSLPRQAVQVGELLQAVIKTATPLFQASQARCECLLAEGLPELAAQPAAIRQALLNVLTVAIAHATGGKVRIEAALEGWEVHIRLAPMGGRVAAIPLSPRDRESLEMTRGLLGLCGGSLEVRSAGGERHSFAAEMALRWGPCPRPATPCCRRPPAEQAGGCPARNTGNDPRWDPAAGRTLRSGTRPRRENPG